MSEKKKTITPKKAKALERVVRWAQKKGRPVHTISGIEFRAISRYYR